MTDASSTDAIDHWISTWSAAARCGLGAGAIVLGVVAAIGVSRRLLPSPPPEPAPRRLPRSFRLELVPLLVLVWFAASWLAVTFLAPRPSRDVAAPLDRQLVALAAVAATMALFLALWTSVLGDGLSDLGFTARRLARVVGATLVFYAAWFPVQLGATALENGVGELVGWTPPAQPTVLELAQNVALLRDPVVVAALVLAAPLYEEMIFRGVLLRWLLAVAPAAVAVAVDAALFTAIHPGGYSTVFVLGVALAWLMARTRSIAAPICFHVVHNGLTVLLIALFPG